MGAEPQVGRARLQNSSMILTEALACLVPTPGYTNPLAEPRVLVHLVQTLIVYRVNKVKRVVRRSIRVFLPPSLNRSDTADLRLGTRFGLAWPCDTPTSLPPSISSGRAGASPYQI
jgi:hypothetical protein